jgi:competence protein ComEC
MGELPIRFLFSAPANKLETIPTGVCEAGVYWYWGQFRYEFLHPRLHAGWSNNNASCVLRISSGPHSLLLPGDIELNAESVLLARGELGKTQLVIAPHHGSTTSSGPNLVTRTSPDYVVFTTGYRNRWKFPAEAVVRRWQLAGSCVLNTADSGGLRFSYSANKGFYLQRRAAAEWRRPWVVRRGAESLCAPASPL